MDGLLLFILGCLITHVYYRIASKNTPDWFKPFYKDILSRLPDKKPTKDALAKIFQEALERGDVDLIPEFNIVACKKCGNPAKNLIRDGKAYGNDLTGDFGIEWIKCPKCGWTEEIEH